MNRFDLKPSREFLIFQLIVVAISIFLIALPNVTLIRLLLAAAIVLFAFLYFYRRSFWRSSDAQVKCIIHNEQGWSLLGQDNSESPIELSSGCVATPYFLVLSWQVSASRKKGQTLVWRDALSEAEFRHLSRLYWAEKIN